MNARPDVSLRPTEGPEEGRLRLGLLGGFELQSGALGSRSPRTSSGLSRFLALQGRSVHRAYVAGRLWIDYSEENAHGCLRTTLLRIGRLEHTPVEATSMHLGLAPAVLVDARELEGCAERILYGKRARAADIDVLVHATDLLPDWFEDWIDQERERLRQLRLIALEAAGDGLVAAGRFAEAVIVALAAIAADPVRESAYRLLIRAHLGEGNVGEALRQAVVYRLQLERELGLAPSPKMQELLSGIAP